MPNITLNRNQYEALRSLLDELDNIEDFHSLTNANRINVDGSLAKDNINELRLIVGLEVKD
jgi:hypothetical protein